MSCKVSLEYNIGGINCKWNDTKFSLLWGWVYHTIFIPLQKFVHWILHKNSIIENRKPPPKALNPISALISPSNTSISGEQIYSSHIFNVCFHFLPKLPLKRVENLSSMNLGITKKSNHTPRTLKQLIYPLPYHALNI